MKIEEQVLSIEQMSHLKKIGLEVKEPSHWWCSQCKDARGNDIKSRRWFVALDNSAQTCGFAKWEFIPTLTLQEIFEILPEEIYFEGERAFLIYDKSDKKISYTKEDYEGRINIDCIAFDGGKNLLDVSFYMFCWIIESGYLKRGQYA